MTLSTSSVEVDWRLLLAGLVLVIGLAWSLGRWWQRWIVRRRMGRHRRMGARGERRARKVLKAAGYRIVDCQPRAKTSISVDDSPVTAWVTADFRVQDRAGRLWIAEVKSGIISARVTRRDTRRQLLEYAIVFSVHGVLLVDVPARAVRRVSFPGLNG